MGIWAFAIGSAAFLLSITALGAAILSRVRHRLVFWVPLTLWWLWAAGAWCVVTWTAWRLARWTFPNYFPHALLVACAVVLGIPVVLIHARRQRDGKPRAATWPWLWLVGACLLALAANTVVLGRLDAVAVALAAETRLETDAAYVRLVGAAPAAEDNAADLYREALPQCDQIMDAMDHEAQMQYFRRATTQPVPDNGQVPGPPTPSTLLGDASQAQTPELITLVNRLQPVVRLARQASTRPACRFGEINAAPTFERNMPKLGGFRQVARALYSDALLAAWDGRTDDVVADLRAMRAIERHVQASERGLVRGLVGIGIGQLANDAIVAVLPSLPSVPAEINSLLRDDAAIRDDVFSALRGEQLGTTAMLLDFAENRIEPSLTGESGADGGGRGIRFGATSRLYRVLYLATDLDCARKWFDADLAPLEGREVHVPWQSDESAPMSVVGKVFIGSLSRVTRGTYPEYLATSRCASLCIALARYRIDHGRYPQSLGDLIPRYAASIPADPFDQQPMRYRVDGQTAVVYSIGENKKDDGGQIQPAQGPKTQDVGLELRPPAGVESAR